MANLQGFNLDPNVEESTGSRTIIPEGWQKVVIVGDQLADTKTGGKMLVVSLQIIDGQYAGELIPDRLNIINKSEVAQKIGQGTLKRLCNLTGTPYPPADTSTMYGKPIMGKVTIEEFKTDKGNMANSNHIAKYEAVGKVAETEQATTAPAQAAPGSW